MAPQAFAIDRGEQVHTIEAARALAERTKRLPSRRSKKRTSSKKRVHSKPRKAEEASAEVVGENTAKAKRGTPAPPAAKARTQRRRSAYAAAP